MSATVSHRDTCRLCSSDRVSRVVNLEPIPLSENYTDDRETALQDERHPVDVYMCADCGHVQQLDVIDSENLWKSYTYFSGEAKGMPEHFEDVAQKFLRVSGAPENSLVVDIGSNDGSLLKPFKKAGYRVLGIDPAEGVVKRANEAGIPTIEALMSTELATRIREEHGPAEIVCAFNVFAHADDLGEMADAVRIMLAPDGVFFFEAQYLLDIVDGMLIASIFHEHMSHHSVKPLTRFLNLHGLELIAAERSPVQHGSLIGTVQLKGGKRPVEASVGDLLALEEQRQLDKLETMRAFDREVKRLRDGTGALVRKWQGENAKIAAYGAARSGPMLIAQFRLADAIECIFDDHPQKVGKHSSGDGIPIVPTAELLERMPDYTFILAWVHAQRIIEANQEYLNRGGHFVVLCPETRVVGKDGDVSISDLG
ncbi:MAG: class I SAM-dependent methyltransferase [Parvibaculaceae bacterium]